MPIPAPSSAAADIQMVNPAPPCADSTQPMRHGTWVAACGVLIVHGIVIYGLLQERVPIMHPESLMTVLLLDAPQREPPQSRKSVQLPLMKARLVFDEPQIPDVPDLTTRSDVHVQISTSPETTAAAATMISSPAPVSLTDELAVFCPQRAPPAYPQESRHLREEGEVTLRVELDERGQVSAVSLLKSSGSMRLDQAARAAILRWHCNAALHGGQPVRAVAIQSLDFNLRPR